MNDRQTLTESILPVLIGEATDFSASKTYCEELAVLIKAQVSLKF